MELEEFVRTSLIQIMRGVKAAQKDWKEEMEGGGAINPSWSDHHDLRNRVQQVTFDVAVTAGSRTEGGGGGGIKVFSADISARGTHSRESSKVSRLTFTIPILPATITITDPANDASTPTGGSSPAAT